MRQFIIEDQNIKNGLVILEGKDFHYLRKVLRVKIGDMVNIRLPEGSLENSTVAKIDDKEKKVTLQICGSFDKLRNCKGNSGTQNSKSQSKNERLSSQNNQACSLSDQSWSLSQSKGITRGVQSTEIDGKLPDIEYWLFQFLPKPQKLELIVRQATECGVSVIVPIIGEYTEKSSVMALEGNKKERLERIIKEARQQSGSPVDTKLHTPVTLSDAIAMWNEACHDTENTLGFVLSERDDCDGTLNEIVEKKSEIKKVGIAVGSEGGISPEEVSSLQEKALFHPIHFAVNILRCETAAIYGIAAVQTSINK